MDIDPSVRSDVSSAPVTLEYPVPKAELISALGNAGSPRAVRAVSAEYPDGLPYVRSQQNHRSVLQKHVDFFDRNKDGVIFPWETFQGFRALGFGWILSLLGMLFININFTYPTQPSWIPDPFFRIYTANIHRTKHGSDSEIYDCEGRFVPQKFEEMFSKFDKDAKKGLFFSELLEMTEEYRNAADIFGWIAAKLEWGVAFWIGAENGILSKDSVLGIIDGSFFDQIEARRAEQNRKKRF